MRACAGIQAAALALLLGSVGATGACQARPAAPATRQHSSGRGRMSDLIAQVRAKDPAATLLAHDLGAPAAAELIPLTKDADEEVREIALLCLAETGGKGAVRAMLARVNDPGPMVRGAALRGLERHAAPADVPALLHALEATDDSEGRRYVALLIGRLGTPAAVGSLRPVCAAYSDPATDEGCIAALAQLGDPAAREQFLQRLGTSSDRTLARHLEYAERIRAPWLLPALGALLANHTPLRWIGVDGLPGPHSLRAADIALNLIVEITGRKPAFPVSGNVNYTDDQLASVRAMVAP